jgi:hypothetical protein
MTIIEGHVSLVEEADAVQEIIRAPICRLEGGCRVMIVPAANRRAAAYYGARDLSIQLLRPACHVRWVM